MTKSSLVIFVLGLSVVLAQPLQYQVEEFDEESTATEKPGSQDQAPALGSPGSRSFTASVSGLINGLSEVAGTGAPVGPDGRVIDTSDVTIAKAKHAAAHINQKVSLARESARSNAGGLGKPAEVLLEYQDSLGQYSFGYSAPGSARSEVGSADGSTRGAFSYVDGSGVVQTAKYTADGENGFRIEASNLPVAPSPVEETPEVQAARLEHFRAHEAAKQNLIAVEGQKNEPGKDKAGDAGVKMIKDDKKEEIKEEKKENKDKENSLLLMKLKENSEKESKIPVVTSSFVMPASNLNLQNRIELRGAAGFSGTAPSDWMHQGEAKANEYFKASPQLQLQTSAASQSQFYRGSPIVRYSSFGYPIYYNHHVQYVPSFYYY